MRVTWMIAGALLAMMIGPACAHRTTPVKSIAGLTIPSVSHGQMSVLADNRAAILELADGQYPTDYDMRRLQGFISLQYYYCAWGLFPGSLTDERSPFNECTHAYLAGVRALLLHLQTMPGDRTVVRAVSRKVDLQMLDHHASMILCRFSDEPFNSADVIFPHLAGIFMDPTCLAALLILAAVAAGAGVLTSMTVAFAQRRATLRARSNHQDVDALPPERTPSLLPEGNRLA